MDVAEIRDMMSQRDYTTGNLLPLDAYKAEVMVELRHLAPCDSANVAEHIYWSCARSMSQLSNSFFCNALSNKILTAFCMSCDMVKYFVKMPYGSALKAVRSHQP